PPRVREEKELLSRAAELVERQRQIGIFSDEPRQVTQHGIENGPVAVRLVDALADVREELAVVDFHLALLERVDERRVERDLAQRVERVDPVVARRRWAKTL